MNDCVVMREQLADVALGRPAGKELTGHLRECAACAAELERLRALAQLMDAAVQKLVGASPPASLIDGIAARVRDAAPNPWSRRWMGIAVGAGLAASVALAFGLRALQPYAPQSPNIVALTAWRSPTAVLLEPRGSVLRAPLRDTWFDLGSGLSHSKPSPGEKHGT